MSTTTETNPVRLAILDAVRAVTRYHREDGAAATRAIPEQSWRDGAAIHAGVYFGGGPDADRYIEAYVIAALAAVEGLAELS